MRELDQVGTALADALGFSAEQTEAHLKLLCRGVDKNARQTILILECRLQPKRAPIVDQQKSGTKPAKKLKGPGKPKTQVPLAVPNGLGKQAKVM